MLSHVFQRPQREEDNDSLPSRQSGKTVRVRLSTSSGGRRYVELPRDQVEGHTPLEVLEAALTAIEDRSAAGSGLQAAADLTFAQDVRRLMTEPGFGLDASTGEHFLLPTSRVTHKVLSEELFLDMGVDHRAG